MVWIFHYIYVMLTDEEREGGIFSLNRLTCVFFIVYLGAI
jgi:hypothetical protein